jgi:hypothetical protein
VRCCTAQDLHAALHPAHLSGQPQAHPSGYFIRNEQIARTPLISSTLLESASTIKHFVLSTLLKQTEQQNNMTDGRALFLQTFLSLAFLFFFTFIGPKH